MWTRQRVAPAICPRAIRAFTSAWERIPKIDSLVITWPSGQVDKLTNVPVDSIIAVKEGVGIVPHPFPKVHSR